MQATHWCSGIDEARVIIVHPINVRPYLYLVYSESCTDERSSVVTTPTLEVVDISEGIATDIAFGDEELGA